MAIRVTYSIAKANLRALLDKVAKSRKTVIIDRPGKPDVAVLKADELSGLKETLHLLRSPKNASRLLGALQRSTRGFQT